jgi:hypothetical protein
LRSADPADAAGQIRRLWKLDKLAQMPDSERNLFIAERMGSLDPELRQAILEAPEYAKLLPSTLDHIRDGALREQHGEEALAEVAQLEEGIKIAEDVVTIAREEVAKDAGGAEKFEAAVKPYEKGNAAVWLKKFNVDGKEVVKSFEIVSPREGRWREATPQEQDEGVFYPDGDAYHRAQVEIIAAMNRSKQNGNATA